MKAVRITALRQASYPDLSERLELPQNTPCEMRVGDTFTVTEPTCPAGFCESAWETLRPFVEKLLQGEGHFYGDWMKNPYSALLSCNDGFRPVSFYLERTED